MDETRIHPAGDPFTAKTPKPSEAEERLAEFEETLRHELMGDEKRQALRDEVLALRRRLEREQR